jgi:hypothetical protein
LLSQRAFTNSCLNMSNRPPPGAPAGESFAGIGITHRLDPIPTEIHVFMAIWMEVPVFVATDGPERLWQVTPDKIEQVNQPVERGT